MLRKKIFLICAFFLASFSFYAQISIAEARQQSLGSTVFIEGIVLNGSEAGYLRFLQDDTAGIALYDGANGSESVQTFKPGDRVQVTGTLGNYKGLLELDFVESVSLISTGNSLPSPKEINLASWTDEFESQLISIPCVHFNTSGNFTPDTYQIEQSGIGDGIAYIPENSLLNGANIPSGKVNLVGILSQFNDPQILLTTLESIQAASCLFFEVYPYESNLLQSSLQIQYSASDEVTTQVFFGLDPNNLSLVEEGANAQDYLFEFLNLDPATVYYVQVSITKENETVWSPVRAVCTASNSSGTIKVYFNNPVDESYSDGSVVSGETLDDVESAILASIANASESIDVAMYNTNRAILVNALIDAHNKGVKIRYIADDATGNAALNNLPFEVLKDPSSNDLMHNKFMVFDVDSPAGATVIQGAMNFTNNQMSIDPNNLIFIQDQSLAKAYTLEFNEMWGSETVIPNPIEARFGSAKTDNTPHYFSIDNRFVECYFSPSDGTTENIKRRILETESNLSISLLTFTNNVLGEAVINQSKKGVDTRIIIENYDDTGTEFNKLTSEGVSVASHPTFPIFHHKYAILDEGDENKAMLINGSHNWTLKAETSNDENTLIIHDQSIVNQFRQEFEYWWNQLVNDSQEMFQTDVIITPNPFESRIYIATDFDFQKYYIFNLQGSMIQEGDFKQDLFLDNLMEGVYLLMLQSDSDFVVHKIIKAK